MYVVRCTITLAKLKAKLGWLYHQLGIVIGHTLCTGFSEFAAGSFCQDGVAQREQQR